MSLRSTHCVGICQIPCVGEPTAEVVVGRPPRHVVDHERAGRAAVVGPRHGAEPLLARRVPDLQLDLLAGNLDDARAELHADRVRAVGHDWKQTREETFETLKTASSE